MHRQPLSNDNGFDETLSDYWPGFQGCSIFDIKSDNTDAILSHSYYFRLDPGAIQTIYLLT